MDVQSNGKYNIKPSTVGRDERGIVTTSTLTINDVTGFDSDYVECSARFSEGTVTVTERSSAVLAVLGKIELPVEGSQNIRALH